MIWCCGVEWVVNKESINMHSFIPQIVRHTLFGEPVARDKVERKWFEYFSVIASTPHVQRQRTCEEIENVPVTTPKTA